LTYFAHLWAFLSLGSRCARVERITTEVRSTCVS